MADKENLNALKGWFIIFCAVVIGVVIGICIGVTAAVLVGGACYG